MFFKDRNVRIGWLLDFYGPLLTGKQRRALELRWNDDLSLAEIGEAMGMSRQAVNDATGRGEARLIRLEEKLGLLRRFETVSRELERCVELAGEIAAERPSPEAERLVAQLERTVRAWEE